MNSRETMIATASFAAGWAAALDAAREAVEVVVTDALEALNPLDPQTVNRALAAIDALRAAE